VKKVKKVNSMLLLAFSLAMITGNAQQVIYGKYKYMDSLTFATYKNNGSGDSVLSVDAQGRLKLKKVSAGDTASLSNRINLKLNISDTSSMLTPYLRKADTSTMLSPYLRKADTTSLSNRINAKLSLSDTSTMLTPYLRKADTSNKFVASVTSLNDSTIRVIKGSTLTDIVIKPVTTVTNATRLITTVYNKSGALITKGSVVYISGAHSSNLPSIDLAKANTKVKKETEVS
jgi:hypothetical protein